jgi:hypothetical protein
VSFRAVAWAFDRIKGLGQGEKLVLLALAEFANDEDETWRSREEIAKRAECSLRSVASHLKTLDECGLVSRVPRYSWCGDQSGACADKPAHKHRSGTTYRLHLEVEGDFAESTHANLARVEISAECSGCGHTCKSCTCGDDKASTHAKSGSPHMQRVAPICTYNPQLNLQTRPARVREEAHRTQMDESVGQVRSGVDERSVADDSSHGREDDQELSTPSGFEGVEEVAGLIAQCLPPSMQGMDTKGAKRVAAMLQERIEAGWPPELIRIRMDQPLPSKVSRMSSFVATRLEANILPAFAPRRNESSTAADAREREQRAREERSRRAEAIAVSLKQDVDPLWEQAWYEVVAENPNASRVEQVRLARARHEVLVGGVKA